MTSPDPEEQNRPDATGEGASPTDTNQHEPDGAPTTPSRGLELPADVDAAFASIVADWVATDAPVWPSDPEVPEATRGEIDATEGPSSELGTATPPSGHPAADPPTSSPPTPRRREPTASPEEHFVPPEPPPLPRLGLSSMLGILLLVIGVVLLALPGLMGGPLGLGIVPGLLSMTAGLGWLVFGMRRPRERGDGHGPDDGAVL